jgi:hypothetical protein
LGAIGQMPRHRGAHLRWHLRSCDCALGVAAARRQRQGNASPPHPHLRTLLAPHQAPKVVPQRHHLPPLAVQR